MNDGTASVEERTKILFWDTCPWIIKRSSARVEENRSDAPQHGVR